MNKLNEIIKANKIKVAQLCREIGLSRQSLYDIMDDKQIPTVYNALKIARYLKLKIEDIWTL